MVVFGTARKFCSVVSSVLFDTGRIVSRFGSSYSTHTASLASGAHITTCHVLSYQGKDVQCLSPFVCMRLSTQRCRISLIFGNLVTGKVRASAVNTVEIGKLKKHNTQIHAYMYTCIQKQSNTRINEDMYSKHVNTSINVTIHQKRSQQN